MSSESASKNSPNTLPTQDELTKAYALQIFNSKGEKVTFGSLLEEGRAIVVFVRHFLCGNCQDYLRQLAKIPQSSLDDVQTRIIVIGCGEWTAIEFYAKASGFGGTICADPSRELYRTLGMTLETLAQTPEGEQRKSYLDRSRLRNMLQSIGKGLMSPTTIGKQGNMKQTGGEFILGPGLQCTFAYRMQHSEDHTEVDELLKAAGIKI